MKFKVGDRVKVNKNHYASSDLTKRTGVVRRVTEYVVGVIFKNWGRGHNLSIPGLKGDNGWYFAPSSIARAKKRKAVTKKKVRRAR